MNKIRNLFLSMAKIGLIGFGGGNALIPVIEKTAIEEQGLIEKDEYDVDVMVASITPGALPVEVAGGIGRRVKGSFGLLLGATAMALPGVILTILLTSVMSSVSANLLKQIGFLAIGIYAFICCLLIGYIEGTVKKSHDNGNIKSCLVVMSCVILLVCGKNLYRFVPGEISSIFSLSTIQIFVMAFFVIFYTRGKVSTLSLLISTICCVVFTLCHCKAEIISNQYIKYADYVAMTGLSLYGLCLDVKKGWKRQREASYINAVKDIGACCLFAIILSVPAICVTVDTLIFAGRGFISSIMSFGGGDAYLTVADGMFVGTGMITENEFYSMLVPLVNVLPGSILCKTLSGVGYYVGLANTGNVLGGLAVALCGFAVSVAASCGVFTAVAGLYDIFGTLNIFQIIKKWIRPIVSGLLVNVMLSLLVQVKKQEAVFSNGIIPFLIVLFIFIVDEILYRKYKVKNEVAALVSVAMSIVLCNLL